MKINTSQRLPKPETQPSILRPNPPTLITVFGSHTVEPVCKQIQSMLNQSSLNMLTIGKADSVLAAEEVIQKVADHLDWKGHVLLCIHGKKMPKEITGLARDEHLARLSSDSSHQTPTEELMSSLLDSLGHRSAHAELAEPQTPMLHLLSCESDYLREQIKPDSALWKSAYVLLYSGKVSTGLHTVGNALKAVIAYLDYCDQHHLKPDPLKLLYIAGLHRSSDLSLMGGDLKAALVWPAPQKESEMRDEISLKQLKGHATDVRRLRTAASQLSTDERQLIAPASLQELLSARIEMDDVRGLSDVLKHHPTLLNAYDDLHDSALILSINAGAYACMNYLLQAGAAINTEAGPNNAPFIAATEASRKGDVRAMDLLLAHGADINYVCTDRDTAMHVAGMTDNVYAIKKLLDKGARTDLLNEKKETPLMTAVHHHAMHAVEFLLSQEGPESTHDYMALSRWAKAERNNELERLLVGAEVRRVLSKQNKEGFS